MKNAVPCPCHPQVFSVHAKVDEDATGPIAFPTVSAVTARPLATKRSSEDVALLVKAAFNKLLDIRADAQMRCKTLATGMLGEKGKKQAVTAAMTLVTMQ